MDSDRTPHLAELATRVVEQARQAGADVAEVSAQAGWELSAQVRLGEVELLEEAGVPIRELRAIGGGAKSRLWMQLKADLMGKKIVSLAASLSG